MTNPAPSNKRPRVQLACRQCRDRKTRCDGRQPICLACESRGVGAMCIFESLPKRHKKPGAAEQRGVYTATSNSRGSVSWRPLTMEPARASEPSRPSASEPALRFRPTPQDMAPSIEEDEELDGLATVPSYGRGDESYGPSSTIGFSRSAIPLDGNSALVAHRTSVARVPTRPTHGNITDHVLPFRRNADEYLRCYWNFIYPVFPMLDRMAFDQRYEAIWLPAAVDAVAEDYVFVASLNLVFALGCRFSESMPPEQRDTAAEQFFHRSREAHSHDMFDRPSLMLVQLLLLTGVYLQSAHSATACWNAVGSAIRVAQGLGLHTTYFQAVNDSGGDMQLRRKIWHCCVSLDRLLAMTFGRPTTLQRMDNVPLPETIDDMETISSSGQQSAVEFSQLTLFVYSCKLFDILHDALDILNSFSPENRRMEDSLANDVPIVQLLEINSRLDTFQRGLPLELRDVQVSQLEGLEPLNLHRQVLYCRLLYVRLLSLRPILLHRLRMAHAFTPEAQPTFFGDRLIQTACDECLETACLLIESIYTNLATPYRSAGWHAVYFTFSAATVVLACVNTISLPANLRAEHFDTFWQQCIDILDHHSRSVDTAARALVILRTMRQHVEGSRGRSARVAQHTEVYDIDESVAVARNTTSEAMPDIGDFDFDRLSEGWLEQCLVGLDWPLEPSADA